MTSSVSAAAPARGGLAVAAALAIVYVVWGSTYLGIRFALEGGFPPLLMVSGSRFVAAGLVLFLFLRWRGVAAPTRAQWKNLLVMGALLLLMGNGMVVLAEQTVSSGLAAVAVASMPLWMGLFGAMRGQHPTRGEWLGIIVGFAGVVWLNAGSSLTGSPVGLVLLLVAPIAWAYGSVWSRGRDLPSPFMTAA
ncbi:MAG TPA: EamA family transporter, partial [Pseudoxanthomonas sp.]